MGLVDFISSACCEASFGLQALPDNLTFCLLQTKFSLFPCQPSQTFFSLLTLLRQFFLHRYTEDLWFNSYPNEKVINRYTKPPLFSNTSSKWLIFASIFSFLSLGVTEEVALLLLKVALPIYVLGPMSPQLQAFCFSYALAFLLHHQLHVLDPIILTAHKHILKTSPARTKEISKRVFALTARLPACTAVFLSAVPPSMLPPQLFTCMKCASPLLLIWAMLENTVVLWMALYPVEDLLFYS